MRGTVGLCLLALCAWAEPSVAADQQPSERGPLEQRPARKEAADQQPGKQHATERRPVQQQAVQTQPAERQQPQQQSTEPQDVHQRAADRIAARQQAADERAAIELLIVAHAKTHGLPEKLVRLVVRRESNFNPRAIYRGNYGLMQIRLGTARALGYRGTAEGLLDPATNMTYGAMYLAGAYRAARGDEERTLTLYSRGYYGVR